MRAATHVGAQRARERVDGLRISGATDGAKRIGAISRANANHADASSGRSVRVERDEIGARSVARGMHAIVPSIVGIDQRDEIAIQRSRRTVGKRRKTSDSEAWNGVGVGHRRTGNADVAGERRLQRRSVACEERGEARGVGE